MLRMRTVFEAHDDETVDMADVAVSEKSPFDDDSEPSDEEQPDEKLSVCMADGAAWCSDGVVVVAVVNRGESSGSHSSGNLAHGGTKYGVKESACGRLNRKYSHVFGRPVHQMLNAAGLRDTSSSGRANEHDRSVIATCGRFGAGQSMLQHLHDAVVEEVKHAGCEYRQHETNGIRLGGSETQLMAQSLTRKWLTTIAQLFPAGPQLLRHRRIRRSSVFRLLLVLGRIEVAVHVLLQCELWMDNVLH